MDTSRDFAQWTRARRALGRRAVGWNGRLEIYVPTTDTRVVVTCGDGQQSILAAATLMELGYSDVAALEGGMNCLVAPTGSAG